MIPPIVHQTWKSDDLPRSLKECCASWKRFNPDFDYRFYDDRSCAAFIYAKYPDLAQLYESLPLPILRADLFRYLIVYSFGGLYADIDMECLRPIDRFLSLDGAIFSIEARLTSIRQRELGYRHPYQIANCIFASEAGHPFLRRVIDRAVALLRSQQAITPASVEDITGPRMLTRLFYEGAPQRTRILKQIYWIPYRLYPRLFPLNKNMFAWHHFYRSWAGAMRTTPSLRRRWVERDIPPNPFPRTLFHITDEK
jgi:mannosyltransferase OCH1-like enzyme